MILPTLDRLGGQNGVSGMEIVIDPQHLNTTTLQLMTNVTEVPIQDLKDASRDLSGLDAAEAVVISNSLGNDVDGFVRG